ncbi:hypothetical protein COCCADRAFT_30046 [Bipolaris zeicola 26-R-13]|uniref:Zn(2)-C6 fungal-type domain-containing protein n=1 Tax=Cochliobolus carbonum (strain 26-R-13) TaxID=930089 RepID=W6XUC9_COCC2|nr:uncharacterized protein COCCADRAFT_30046 [Bipolaris zeicola 26-R-13]EUC28755.1 hypothetical protein COCCADRAFT_30046 [Bipolaris zeicola 26-R-13]
MSPSPPKRPSTTMDQQNTAGSSRKRRLRYVWRACDVCRRRKGRCDGRKPCDFCRSRALECRYTADQEPTNEPSQQEDSAVSYSAVAAPPMLPTNALGVNAMLFSKGESISRVVLALQAQLDSLVTHMELSNELHTSPVVAIDPALPRQSAAPRQNTALEGSGSAIPPSRDAQINANPTSTSDAPTVAVANTSKPSTRRFYGPTSPDYSLNAATIKLRLAQAPPGGPTITEETNPSLEDDQTDDDERTLIQDESHGSAVQERLAKTRLRQCLAQLPWLIARNDALRLLNVYHNVIGRLHPILDPKRLVEQAEACYVFHSKPTSDASILHEDTILILYLALSIALAAEPASQSHVGKTLYKGVEHLIKLKLASEVSSLDHVLIALLASIYHFFTGDTRLAWRVCGISGRMAMELGLHRRDVHRHLLRDEKQRTGISALIWSIVILDRQWSAATGLPQNFQESDFDQSIEPPEDAWYLRAMISYTFMSPKFEVPIHRVAAGATYEQDDAFELLNFQIDQWLKKAIDGHGIYHPSPETAVGVKPTVDPSKPPSPVATLLYLRANAFRSIILRPFFLSGSHSNVSVKMIKPSMNIISDTIGVLSMLNSTTDVYKTQHPFFQHFLSSSCALLFLVVAYVRADRNRVVIMQSADLLEPFPGLVKREVERALALATAYSTISQSSCRLAKRLRHLEEQLARPDFLQPPPIETALDRTLQPQQNQQQRFPIQRGLGEKGDTVGGAMGTFLDQGEFLQVADDTMGDHTMNDWPSNEVASQCV